MRKATSILIAFIMSIAAALYAQPAHAIISGSTKVCVSTGSFGDIEVANGRGSMIRLDHRFGACTGWLEPSGVWVDTDPDGPSHSYKLKATGDGANGSYGDCHTNSDNHMSNPPDPTGGSNWTIYYRNYDHGDCTN
jgi:hypothetical protein